MISKGTITIVGAKGAESIFGKDSVTVYNSTGFTKLISTGWVKAVKCDGLGHVSGKEFVKILNCQNVQSVYSENDLDLINSKINGDVKFNGHSLLKNSEIEGTLITGALEVTLDNIKVKDIFVKKVKTNPGQSKRADKVSYMLNRPSAPIQRIRFGAYTLESQTDSGTLTSNLPAFKSQVIKLINNSIVTGTIRFESGDGKVLITRGQPFDALVEGAAIEYV